VALSDNSFDSFLRGFPGSVLAEFWSPRCPHCLEFAPVVREAARETAGKGVIVQVNTDENPSLAARFKVSGVPTVILFHDGKEVKRAGGSMDIQNFLAWINNVSK
jgi:thioredoxin-like negative regulator of GroEL